MNLVSQEDSNGCGVACLAMVTGQTYQQVKAQIPAFDNTGMGEFVIDSYLADRGYAVARKHPHAAYRKVMREDWPPAPWSDIHIVSVSLPAGFHLIVMLADGAVLDPALGCKHISDYSEIMHVAAVTRMPHGLASR